jgi:hypothetical protein
MILPTARMREEQRCRQTWWRHAADQTVARSTVVLDESGSTGTGHYSLTGSVTIAASVTVSGDSSGGSVTESVQVCADFSYHETGGTSFDTGSTHYDLTVGGSYCFDYYAEGGYTTLPNGVLSTAATRSASRATCTSTSSRMPATCSRGRRKGTQRT